MKENETDIKIKNSKKRKIVIIIIILGILLLGLQVYATTNGYDNIFFMIKNLISSEKVTGEENLFSDQDITLSYKSIDLNDNIKIQINRLGIKDGESTLYITVKPQKPEKIPLHYYISTSSQKSEIDIVGTEPKQNPTTEYQDILKMNYVINSNDIITIVVKNNSDELLRTLEINMQTREISVKGTESVGKISKIELRKYLDLFSELNNDLNKSDILLNIAEKILNNHYEFMEDDDYDEALKFYTDRGLKNAIINEFYGDNAEYIIVSQKDITLPEVKIIKGIENWEYDVEGDTYKSKSSRSDYKNGHCLNIKDISYKNGIYTVNYIYVLATKNEEDNLEDLEQYETTIKLKRDENQLFSKYQVISIELGKKIKDKIQTTIEEEINESTDVNIIEDYNNTNENNIENTNTYSNSTNYQYENVIENSNTVNHQNENYIEINENETILDKSEYLETTNWKQVWPEWIGMKFKCPNNFVQGEVIQDENNRTVSVDMTGTIDVALWGKDPERIPVRITFYNKFSDNLENVLENYKVTQSTDNKGWSDWYVVNEEYVTTERLERIL